MDDNQINAQTTSPLVSIIIVVYNASSCIKNAIESVCEQCGNCELIIIDGNSNDGTIEVIKRYEHHIAYWVSEVDTGIYDAMNKGVSHATGKWIYFLGSDDIIMPNIIKQIDSTLSCSDETIVYGDVVYEDGVHFKSKYSIKTYLQNTIHHQASFYRRDLFAKFSYDVKLKIIADYELNLMIYKNKLPRKRLNEVIAKCRKGGSSYDKALSLSETNLVRKKYLNRHVNSCLQLILTIKYYLSYVLL